MRTIASILLSVSVIAAAGCVSAKATRGDAILNLGNETTEPQGPSSSQPATRPAKIELDADQIAAQVAAKVSADISIQIDTKLSASIDRIETKLSSRIDVTSEFPIGVAVVLSIMALGLLVTGGMNNWRWAAALEAERVAHREEMSAERMRSHERELAREARRRERGGG